MLLKRGPVYVYALAGGGKGKGVTSTSSLQENLCKNLTFICLLMHLLELPFALEVRSDPKRPGAGSNLI